MDARQVWHAALERIAQRVSDGAFTTWFRGTTGLGFSEGALVVGVSNTFACEHLRLRFSDVALQAVRDVTGRAIAVAFRYVDPRLHTGLPGATPTQSDSPPPRRRTGRSVRSAHAAPAAAVEPRPAPRGGRASAAQPALPGVSLATPAPARGAPPAVAARTTTPPRPEIAPNSHELHAQYRFETFVVGDSNRFAYAAAQEIAYAPGVRYNPLLIYGGVGLGKTHLLHAIGHHARLDGLRVAYVTAERFTNEIIEAIRARTTDLFRARYRSVDVLLVDDVEFIAGKDSTEEEFFHTFNALHEADKQIVLTSDCVPQAMRHLHARLRSRFAWGLIADLQPPDYAHRLEILRAKAAAQRLDIRDDVLACLARPDCASVRELEGTLTRVVAYAQVLGQPVDMSLVVRALASMRSVQAQSGGRQTPLNADEVLVAVAQHFGVTVEGLRGKSREHQLAWARQMAMYLLREETDASLFQIGRQLGGRDHTTVMHGCARVAAALEKDARHRQDVAAIREALRR